MIPTILSTGITDNPPTATLYYGQDVLDTLKVLPDNSVHMICTSPPYWGLRDYGEDGQLGCEATPILYVERMVQIFTEAYRVLRDDGVLWLNLGDSYGGTKGDMFSGGSVQMPPGKRLGKTLGGAITKAVAPKQLAGIPWRTAFALQDAGWILRQDIIWEKPNVLPEMVKDRCTRNHEYIFLFAKQTKYYFDVEAIKEPALTKGAILRGRVVAGERRKRSVWSVPPVPLRKMHFATWPPKLVEMMVGAGTSKYGVCSACGAPDTVEGRICVHKDAPKSAPIVMDMFSGSGTTGMVCLQMGRNYIGCDIQLEYLDLAINRITGTPVVLEQPEQVYEDLFI